MYKSHRKGFTAIELLVVVCIMAMLLGIAAHVVTAIKHRGNSNGTVTSNLEQAQEEPQYESQELDEE